jgi:20S proteasome subunit beta 4
MDVTFGVVGDGFVLLVSDTSRVQSILVQRTEVDKILQLDSHKLLARAPLASAGRRDTSR